MKKGTKILIGAAASLALVMTPMIGLATTTPYSASCDATGDVAGDPGSSSFTAERKGFYTWVWRTGRTVNGGGITYLREGQTMLLSTPGAATSSTRFGVLTTSKTYAYIFCSENS